MPPSPTVRRCDWLAAGPLRQVLRLDDSDYPSGLLNTPCPPPLLFLLGRRELLQRPMLAVVGSRHASVQGRKPQKAGPRRWRRPG